MSAAPYGCRRPGNNYGGIGKVTDQNFKTLQDLVDNTPDLVNYFYNDTPGPYSRTRRNDVPAEHTNWRDEQRAWRETACIFDQSHHMPELFVRGKDALKLLNYIGVNSLANLKPGIAKQFIACNHQGYMIGECVLHDLGNDSYELISGRPLQSWVRYHAATGGYDVEVVVDEATPDNPSGRRINFRYGMDGPNARKIFEEVIEDAMPEIRFFHTARVKIAGVECLALRHGMAGHMGVEISGPYDDRDKVLDAILAVGEKHGLKRGGSKAYFSAQYESGWIAHPLPAIYTAEDLRGYREWLPGDEWEARFQLAGSFVSNSIEDYYVNPLDMGYGRIINFDHDFIGREALRRMMDQPHRNKVTLVWNKEDVLKVYASLLEEGTPYKFMDMPVADFGFPPRDEVRGKDGRLIGLSTLTGYTVNENAFLSLAIIDAPDAVIGSEVEVVWGEPNGGSRKKRVERHRQINIRATIAPTPYARFVQQKKRETVS